MFGGKRGFLGHVCARTMFAVGAYNKVTRIEWSSVKRLVFVCRGNICRSPYASSRAKSLGLPVISFGLDAVEGMPADPVAAKNALMRGIDLSAHRSTRLQLPHLKCGDWVIVFEPRQLAELQRNFGNKCPATLLGIWARPIRPHIQDPYGRSDKYFQQCFSMIDRNIGELFDRLMRSRAPAVDDVSAFASREMNHNPREPKVD